MHAPVDPAVAVRRQAKTSDKTDMKKSFFVIEFSSARDSSANESGIGPFRIIVSMEVPPCGRQQFQLAPLLALVSR